MASNYRDRTCRECAIMFSGGPRAWYCPKCRKIRQQKANRDCKARQRRGETRQIGSTDYCVVCSDPYIVDGPNQKYCKKCAPVEIVKVARKLSIDFYYQGKDQINPVRNERRRKPVRVCKLCNKEFDKYGKGYYCKPCLVEIKRLWQARADAKRTGKPAPTELPKKRKIDWSNIDLTKPTRQIMQETGYKYKTILAAKKRFNI